MYLLKLYRPYLHLRKIDGEAEFQLRVAVQLNRHENINVVVPNTVPGDATRKFWLSIVHDASKRDPWVWVAPESYPFFFEPSSDEEEEILVDTTTDQNIDPTRGPQSNLRKGRGKTLHTNADDKPTGNDS